MSLRVVHVPELSRYELLAGDGGQLLGFADVRPAAFIHRHPGEYAELVDPSMRGQFQRPGGP